MRSSKTAPISKQSNPRRSFIKQVLAAGAAVSASGAFASRAAAGAPQAPGIVALDHVAIPIQNVEEMVSFYRALGFLVQESERIISVHFGDQKINFHLPSLWRNGTFTLRAAAAQPPCGDFCWVWEGTRAALAEMLMRATRRSSRRVSGRAVATVETQSVKASTPEIRTAICLNLFVIHKDQRSLSRPSRHRGP